MSSVPFDLYELDAETLDELIAATRRVLDQQPDVIREARLKLEAEEVAYDILAGMLEKFKAPGTGRRITHERTSARKLRDRRRTAANHRAARRPRIRGLYEPPARAVQRGPTSSPGGLTGLLQRPRTRPGR